MEIDSMIDKAAKRIPSSKPAEQVKQEMNERMAANGFHGPRMTFAADGTFSFEGMDIPGEEKARWTVTDSTEDRITISVEERGPVRKGQTDTWTFVFETPDLIRHEDGLMKGEKLRRVP